MHHRTLAALLLWLTSATAALASEPPLMPASVDTVPMIRALAEEEAPAEVEADSTYYSSAERPLELEMITVSARRISRRAGADRIELDSELVETRDAGTVADLSTLMPSTKLTVNSRGESLFMVRGSNERHLRVELDGIPLTVPWDERADLSLIPLLAIDGVEARRGVGSVLDDPNSLAGTVILQMRRQVLEGSASRIAAQAGEAGAWGLQGFHQRRHGPWNYLLAAEHRRRDGFLVPDGAQAGLHQDPSRRLRLNSAYRLSSALARVEREFADTGRWHLLVQASDGEKAVPPEEHLADPRFWRYPSVQRLLVGTRLRTPEDSRWTLDTSMSADFLRQDVDSFPDRTYTTRDAWEEDRERTAYWRGRIARSLGSGTVARVRATARYAEHRERTDDHPEELLFAQMLGGAAGEIEHRFDAGVKLRAGAGYEAATTPESGDKQRIEAAHELAMQAAVEGTFATDGRWHLNASRRPRMPSLRELYSGALDRFVPNDDLDPERQDAVEAGLSWQASRWNLSVNGFAQRVDGAIERVQAPGDPDRFQRVNLDEVRHLGIEIGSVIKPLRGLAFDLQGTWLHSRAQEPDGDFDGRVEDRPDWLATLAGTWTHPAGLRLRVELDGVGERRSLDARAADPANAFATLDATARLNLRFSWRHFGDVGGYAGSEWYVRVDNLLDEETWSQLGLVESGRMVMAGVRFDLDR